MKKQDPKRKIWFFIFYLPHFSLRNFLDPFISQKIISSDYRLHGTQNDQLEPTFSPQKSVLKYMHQVLRYWQKVSKFSCSSKTTKIGYLFANIFGPNAYFSKPIFALKPWAQAGHFEYHEAHNRNNFFWLIKGSRNF